MTDNLRSNTNQSLVKCERPLQMSIFQLLMRKTTLQFPLNGIRPHGQNTRWQHLSDVWGLNLRDPVLYSLLAPLFKPTWHSALHPEEQEIKLRSTLVCWADLLPPRCYLIIQELWNVPLYGSMQPECLCLPLMTVHSLSFHLSMGGFKHACLCTMWECTAKD